MTLTREKIAQSLHVNGNFPIWEARRMVDRALEMIAATLASGEDVLISGFGKFVVKKKGKRRGRNPQTGDDLMLRGRQVVTFRSSGVLRDRINGDTMSTA